MKLRRMSEVTETPGAENDRAIMKGKKQVAVLLFRQMLCEGSASEGTGWCVLIFAYIKDAPEHGATLGGKFSNTFSESGALALGCLAEWIRSYGT